MDILPGRTALFVMGEWEGLWRWRKNVERGPLHAHISEKSQGQNSVS